MFKGRIYRQEEGGSIGLDLTGVISEIYMSWWDSELKILLRGARIITILYKTYVNDINMALSIEIQEGIVGPKDKYVMEKVKALANTIHDNIKATCDYGSNYEDHKLPMLDLKIWSGQISDVENKIMYEHYMKDVSSRHVIHYRSAHPEDMKISVLVNEALRILRNCSKHLPRQERTKHLQYLVNRMQYSGYPQIYRYEVISRALKIHDAIMRRERRRSTKKDKRKWYDEKRYDGVMFVDVTLNGEMKQRVEKAFRRNKMKVKVVEKIRRMVKKELQRSNPYEWEHCGRNDCVTCNLGIRINCRSRGLVYEIRCEDCERNVIEKMYRGQTGRSTYERMKEHFSKWLSGAEDSPLHKHSVEYHNSEPFEVDVRILAQCYGKPTTRLITEAIHIEELPDENSLNEKTEWNYIKLPRVAVV